MNKEDFERLKAVCEKEGYVVSTGGLIPGSSMLVEVYKKDVWDGVEFAECVAFADIHGKTNGFLTFGKIYRVSNIVSGSTDCHIINDWGYEGNCMLNLLKPSTESSYIEQLKKEFEDRGIRKFKIRNTDISMMNGGCLKDPLPEFIYRKDTDTLYFHGVPVYQQGKWATKLPERVKVELLKMDCDKYNDKATKHTLKFLVSEEMVISKEVGKFLAEQLEKYLNGEIE